MYITSAGLELISMGVESDSLLLVLPVPFRHDAEGNLLIEKQACNGLDLWAQHFRRVIVACPLAPDTTHQNNATLEYVVAGILKARDRIEFIPLPWAYDLTSFLKAYSATRKLLAESINRCEYLSFAIGGLIGDWASIAALESIHLGRRFSIWTDRVEHQVIRTSYLDVKGPKKIYRFIRDGFVTSPLMKKLEKYIIAKCDLGLFHGRDCFDSYSPYCCNAHLVHDIHLKSEDCIAPQQLRDKISHVQYGKPLRLIYVGRVASLKGPFDWVQVMENLRSLGVVFSASWIGDGPLLAELREEVIRLGLSQVVDFPGFISDRIQLLKAIRDSDLLVFCHKVPESPRCLIEALMSGTPILGYDSPYPRGLVGALNKALLTPQNDVTKLAERISHYDSNRDQLAELIRLCHQLGTQFSDQAVFKHRSDLIKDNLRMKNMAV